MRVATSFGIFAFLSAWLVSASSKTRPTCDPDLNTSAVRTIGYYQSWSYGRNGCSRKPTDTHAQLLTHFNYAFALVGDDDRVAAMSPDDMNLWHEAIKLKEKNPALKVSITVGGWAVRSSTFSAMARSEARRSTFIQSLLSFMDTYAFDGIDLYWEKPGIIEEGGSPEDGENYVHLVRELRRAIGVEVEVSVVIPAAQQYLADFRLAEMAKYVNWFNLKSYDMHSPHDGDDQWRNLQVQTHANLTEIDHALDLLWDAGLAPGQVVLGVGFYGRSFSLAGQACGSPMCPYSGAGLPGPCTQTPGILSLVEIHDRINERGLKPGYDEIAGIKWVSWDGQWVSFDDAETFKAKAKFANERCLAGTMIWGLDLDGDYRPMLLAVADALTGRPEWVEEHEDVWQRVMLNAKFRTAVRDQGDGGTTVILSECSKTPRCPPGFEILTSASGFWSFMGKTGAACPMIRNPTSAVYNYYEPNSRVLCIEEDVETRGCEWYGTPLFCSGFGFIDPSRPKEEQVLNMPGGCPAGTILIATNNQPSVGGKAVPDTCFPGTMSSFCCEKVGTNNKVRECAAWDFGTMFLAGGAVAGTGSVDSVIGRIQRRRDKLVGRPGETSDVEDLARFGDYSTCEMRRVLGGAGRLSV